MCVSLEQTGSETGSSKEERQARTVKAHLTTKVFIPGSGLQISTGSFPPLPSLEQLFSVRVAFIVSLSSQ